jgi:hypothetical protein
MKPLNKNKKGTKRGNLRSRVKNPALLTHYNLKIRIPEIDYDYVHKLSDKDKAWLNEFTEGWINAKPTKLFSDPKELYTRNNARNRCIISREEAKSNLSYFSQLVKNGGVKTDNWDEIMETLDESKSVKKKRGRKPKA